MCHLSFGLYLPCISFSLLLTLLCPYILSLITSTKLFQSIVLQSMSFNWQDSNVFCLMVFLGFFKNLFLSSIFPLFSCFLYFSTSFFVLGWRGMCSFCLWHSCFYFLTSFIKLPFHTYSCNSNL